MPAKADDLILFVFVVDAGSFSKVAEQLNLTNSVVSKRIARLELALNTQLLYRTTRKLSLTDAGRTLYVKAKAAKLAVQEAEDSITGYSEEVRGTIKLTMPVVSAQFVLNEALANFCYDYPNVNVDLSIDNNVVDIIGEGYDIAIRTAHLEDSSLIARRLLDSTWIVCASPKYLSNKGTPQTPKDLSHHNCLVYQYEGTGSEQWLFKQNEQEYFIKVNGSFRSNNLSSLREAALSSLGVVYLPKALIHQDISKGNLTPILTSVTGKYLGIYAVYPQSRQPDKKLKLLIEYFKKALESKAEYFN